MSGVVHRGRGYVPLSACQALADELVELRAYQARVRAAMRELSARVEGSALAHRDGLLEAHRLLAAADHGTLADQLYESLPIRLQAEEDTMHDDTTPAERLRYLLQDLGVPEEDAVKTAAACGSTEDDLLQWATLQSLGLSPTSACRALRASGFEVSHG